MQYSSSDQPHFDLQQSLREAIALAGMGRFGEALALYERILGDQPDHLEALNNYAATLGMLRRDQEAIPVLERVLRIKPDYVEALNNLGSSLARLRQFGNAVASFDRALAVRPAFSEALKNRGSALIGMQRYEEALQSLDRALTIDRKDHGLLHGRGKLLAFLGRENEALTSFDSALALAPEFLDALLERGNVLLKMQRYQDALKSFDDALAIAPTLVAALNNRGYTLEKLGQYEDALQAYDRALTIRPDDVKVLDNRGIALAKLGRFEEALESEDSAQKVEPDFAKAHLHEAFTRLKLGDFGLGFRKYEWRRVIDKQNEAVRTFQQPLWIGKGSLAGKSILLHGEQGIGDLIQFVRYASLVAGRGATVFLEVPEVVAPLMGGIAGVQQVLIQGEPLPMTDFHCPLLSLPLAFGTTLQSIPASSSYLSVDPSSAASWKTKLSKDNEKLIGVCWRGNPAYRDDHERSMQFSDFAPLLVMQGFRFVSLQKELTEDERRLAGRLPMVHPGETFKITSELIAALDLVISVDTAWAHWAGAIGKPFWVLLPFSAHWAWLTEREDSPWYPTARLFRQPKPGDWKSVIRQVKKELAKQPDTV